MITERKPLTLHEAEEIISNLKETEKTKELKSFIKKFAKDDAKKAKKLKEELTNMNILKLKEKDIIKIVDIMPENAIELNKVVVEAGLDTDETNKILETIKSVK
jgi:DNA-directed RNA polymerase subunit F